MMVFPLDPVSEILSVVLGRVRTARGLMSIIVLAKFSLDFHRPCDAMEPADPSNSRKNQIQGSNRGMFQHKGADQSNEHDPVLTPQRNPPHVTSLCEDDTKAGVFFFINGGGRTDHVGNTHQFELYPSLLGTKSIPIMVKKNKLFNLGRTWP